MLAYKALYRKMMDGLKDSGMWLDWAEQMKEKHPDVADFLVASAKSRLEQDFEDTYKHFEALCTETKEDKDGMGALIVEELREWHGSLMNRIHKW